MPPSPRRATRGLGVWARGVPGTSRAHPGQLAGTSAAIDGAYATLGL